MMEVDPETWKSIYKMAGSGVAGAIITAATLFGIAKAKVNAAVRAGDQSYTLGMTEQQRLLLESVQAQVSAQSERTDALQRDITTQREYYESRIDELRHGYRAELQKQEEICHKRLQELQKQVDLLVQQRHSYFQGPSDEEL